jgi:hypothetical protein
MECDLEHKPAAGADGYRRREQQPSAHHDEDCCQMDNYKL